MKRGCALAGAEGVAGLGLRELFSSELESAGTGEVEIGGAAGTETCAALFALHPASRIAITVKAKILGRYPGFKNGPTFF